MSENKAREEFEEIAHDSDFYSQMNHREIAFRYYCEGIDSRDKEVAELKEFIGELYEAANPLGDQERERWNSKYNKLGCDL